MKFSFVLVLVALCVSVQAHNRVFSRIQQTLQAGALNGDCTEPNFHCASGKCCGQKGAKQGFCFSGACGDIDTVELKATEQSSGSGECSAPTWTCSSGKCCSQLGASQGLCLPDCAALGMTEKKAETPVPTPTAACDNDANFLEKICPAAKKTVVQDEYKKFFDEPRGKGLDDPAALAKLKTSWDKMHLIMGARAKRRILEYVKAKLTSDTKAADVKKVFTVLKKFNIDENLAEGSWQMFGGVQIAYAEINAAGPMGFREYLEFALTHELCHAMDPKITLDGGAEQVYKDVKAIMTKLFGTLRTNIETKWSGKKAAETFADTCAALVLAEGTLNTQAAILKMILPMCGAATHGADYPDVPTRMKQIVRTEGFYQTMCASVTGGRGTANTDYFTLA